MSRFGSFFRSAAPSSAPSPSGSQTELAAQELAKIEDALKSASLIMNDDIDGAEEQLRKGDSTVHVLGLAVCAFMRAVLGFEKSIMNEASERLYECENNAWAALKKAQKDAGSTTTLPGKIYPPGTEYSIIVAEAQLMSAIVGVLHESLTEGIKSFYKLRKAYVTLDEVMQAEAAHLRKQGIESKNGTPSAPALTAESSTKTGAAEDEDSDLEFVDAKEAPSGLQTPMEYTGHLSGAGGTTSTTEKLAGLSLESKVVNGHKPLGLLEDGDGVFKDPMDVFIYSGSNACFGVLTLVISMVPPAFSKLLSIIGFKGERERGIQMLWESTRFQNINGAIAGLMILGYYHGLLGFSDILPSEKDAEDGAIVGYPRTRCAALLASMRAQYPESGLWRLEEARIKAISNDLHGAIEILKGNNNSKMRQVVALNNFELSLNAMYLGEYSLMRDSFLKCVELNDWSHALYYYVAGCASLEMYRNAFHSEKKVDMALHKKQAEEFFRKAPTVAGKKRFMAKPMPFEQFVMRRLQKWEERVKEFGGIDLADVVGISPAQEMVYLWNGTKKMQRPQLEKIEATLEWSRLTCPESVRSKIIAEVDEQATRDICLANTYRNLGRFEETRELLDSVMSMDKQAFKTANRDDYAPPAAHYEMAVLAWAEVLQLEQEGDKEALRRKKTDECQTWLEAVAAWEGYVLDARFGMRVNTGMDTLKWYKRHHGWAA